MVGGREGVGQMDRGMSTIMTAAAFAFYKAINGEKLRKPIGWLKTEMELNKYEHTQIALPTQPRCLADCGSGMAITTHRIKFRRARKIAAAALATAAAAELYLRLISLLGCSLDCLLPYGCFLCGPQQIYISFAMVAARSPPYLPPPYLSFYPHCCPSSMAWWWFWQGLRGVEHRWHRWNCANLYRLRSRCLAAPLLLLLLPQSTSTGVAF